jgi:hypothetical protein
MPKAIPRCAQNDRVCQKLLLSCPWKQSAWFRVKFAKPASEYACRADIAEGVGIKDGETWGVCAKDSQYGNCDEPIERIGNIAFPATIARGPLCFYNGQGHAAT